MIQPAILVTGGRGQLGHELVRELSALGSVIAPGRAELDLSVPSTIPAAIRRYRPSIIVNAAAFTAVDQAESDNTMNSTVNAVAPGLLAAEARRIGAVMIHYSTDYVFDGSKEAAYDEGDVTCPINAYGRAKREGEERVAEAGGSWMIIRTSWLYGLRGRNFMRTILALAQTRRELRVVADQFGAPTWCRMVAAATASVVSSAAPSTEGFYSRFGTAAGVYHMTAAGSTSWHGFATAILAHCTPDAAESPVVLPLSSREYPTAAARPRNSVLSSDKVARQFGVQLPAWEEQLSLIAADLLACNAPAAF